MTLAAAQTNLLARVRFQSLRRQKLQLCSSAVVSIRRPRHREPRKGVESRPSLDGLWRRGDPGSRTAPDDPLDRVALLAMTMIRRGHTISGRESGHFNGLRRHFRAARPAALDQDAAARQIDGRRRPTDLRRLRGAARPDPSVASRDRRNGVDGTGQMGLFFRLRRKNKYRTTLPSWQEIVGQELSPIPSDGAYFSPGRATCRL